MEEEVLLDAVEVVDAAKAVPKFVVEMRMKMASIVPRDGILFRRGWDVMVGLVWRVVAAVGDVVCGGFASRQSE